MLDINKEIKQLLESGFDDLDLIAFELQIPLEQVVQCKRELEAEKRKTITIEHKSIKIENKVSIQKTSKMEKMREKFKQLMSGTSKPKVESPQKLLQQDIRLIEEVIRNIKTKIEEMVNLSKKEKRAKVSEILMELIKIENSQLTLEQAEEIFSLISSNDLNGLKIEKGDRIDYFVNEKRKRISIQIVKAIGIKQYEVESIEELRKLERKITPLMLRENPILAEQVKREISTRIAAMQKKSAVEKLRNNIPTDIKSIIKDLINGTIDIVQANAIIDEEARKKVASKPRTRFSMTEEQERKQILLQIRTAIIEKAEEYPIKNPEDTILKVQELCGSDVGTSISTVVRNLISRNDLKAAKIICDGFTGDDVQPEIRSYIKILRNEIRHAEISNVVLAGLNRKGIPKEDEKYFELIEKGISMGNVKLEAVSLGKSAEGSKVTLADIWPEQQIKSK